jgi:hypothetical protein
MAAYPQDFPLAESIEVVKILRKNEVKQKLPLFARNVWTLQGFAMKSTIGDPDSPVTAPSDGNLLPPIIPDPSLFAIKPDGFDPVEALDKLNAAFSGNDVQAQVTVPWKLILKWALEELVQVVASAA